jgi:hypothetical protein
MRRRRFNKHWTPLRKTHHQIEYSASFSSSSLARFRHLFMLPSEFGRLQFSPLPNEGDKTCRHLSPPTRQNINRTTDGLLPHFACGESSTWSLDIFLTRPWILLQFFCSPSLLIHITPPPSSQPRTILSLWILDLIQRTFYPSRYSLFFSSWVFSSPTICCILNTP